MKATRCYSALLLVLSAASLAVAVAIAADAPLATASGHVASVDTSARTLVVKVVDQRGEARDVTFALDDNSKIVKNGAAISAAGLAPGDDVTVTYRSSNGKNVVVNIGVSPKP